MRRLSGLLLAAWLYGCSSRSGADRAAIPERPPEPPEAVVTSLQDESIRQARQELERGQALARGGEWREARLAFDRAVDLLLDVPGGVEANEEAKKLYDEVLATTHEVERAYLAQLSEPVDVTEQSDSAAVDELTKDASLVEEAADLAEPPAGEPHTEEAETSAGLYDIPVEVNSRVRAIIEMFENQKRDWFQEALDRSGYYMPMFRKIFAEEGLPQDAVYLAMVESAFKPRAISRAGARGIWQFISGTGRLYGLKQDFWVDDRFDPEKATRAAARHLMDLYNQFGDWYLAMAAYNCGPNRIDRAIRRSGIRDYWTLAQRRFLPRETRSYVPLILAALVIAKEPEAHGFTPPETSLVQYDVASIDHPVDLETAARSAGTTVEEMKLLNPELRHWVTPLDRDVYALKIPKGTLDAFQDALEAVPEAERVRFGAHTVERGETLSKIARRYGTTVEALAAANRIGARTMLRPGQVLTVPVTPGALADVSDVEKEREATVEDGKEIYIVARGDTLGAIAASFDMTLDELRSRNGLPATESRIHPGQKLVVSSGPPPPSGLRRGRGVAPAKAGPDSPSFEALGGASALGGDDVYVVRPGDTLGAIADAHRISLAALRKRNGMSPRDTRIYPGQRLALGGAASGRVDSGSRSAASSYRIRPGDTLTTIAKKFGVSVEDLRKWNQIDSDDIMVGQSLTIAAGGSQ